MMSLSNRLGRLALMSVAWTGISLCTLMTAWTGWLLGRTAAYSVFGREAVAELWTSDCAEVASQAGPFQPCRQSYRYRVTGADGTRRERTGSFPGRTLPPEREVPSQDGQMPVRYLSFMDSWSRPADAVAADVARWLTVAMLFIPSLFGAAMSRVLLQMVRTKIPRD